MFIVNYVTQKLTVECARRWFRRDAIARAEEEIEFGGHKRVGKEAVADTADNYPNLPRTDGVVWRQQVRGAVVEIVHVPTKREATQ